MWRVCLKRLQTHEVRIKSHDPTGILEKKKKEFYDNIHKYKKECRPNPHLPAVESLKLGLDLFVEHLISGI